MGIVNNASSAVATDFSEMLIANPLFEVTLGDEPALREALIAGDQTMVLVLPQDFDTNLGNTT